jgi:hypothetical protein
MSRTSTGLDQSSNQPAANPIADPRKTPGRLFAVLTLLILTAALALGASAQTSVVDDDGAGSASDCNDAAPAFSTIQDAVAAALPGTIVQVCAGAYNSGSGIAVNKSLTLRGPNSAVSPNGGARNPEAVVNGTGILLRFSSGPSIVEGFKFDSGGGAGDGIIDAYDPALNLTLQKNIFVGGAGRFFFNSPSLLTFNDNYLTGTLDVGEGLFVAGNWNGTTGTAVNIVNNVWENHLTDAMNLSSVSGSIAGNRITNVVYYGILLANSSGSLSIDHNTFDAIVNPDLSVPNWGAGIRFYTPSFIGAVNIKSNAFKNSYTGVGIRQSGGNIAGMDIHVNFNTFVNNANGGIRHDGTGGLDAENNWWGCNYGPGAGGAGCSGTPNGVNGPAAASVDANPWLTLTTSAVPTTIGNGANSTVTSKLTINSALVDTSASGAVPNTTLASFAGTSGTVAPPTSTTTTGVATTVFTANANTPANVATTVNGQTVNAPISINTPCVAVSVPSSTRQRNVGFTVPVTTGDVTGRGVVSYDFTVTYNPSVLSYTGYNKTGTVSDTPSMFITINSSTPGTLIVSGFSETFLTGSGSLIDLNFTSIGAIGTFSAVTPAGFSYNEDNPCTGTSAGTVTIVSGAISGQVTYLNNSSVTPVPGVVLTASGAVVQTNATDAGGLYSLSGLGNSSYTVTPSKTGDLAPGGIGAISGNDASRIAQHVVNISPFTPGGGAFLSADVSGNGTISSFDASMVARFVVALPDTGATGSWRFLPVNRSYTLAQVQTGVTGQNYSAILMGDVTGNWNDTTPSPTRPNVSEEDKISVSAPNKTVRSGSELVIPIEIGNLNRKDITSYQFELAYSPKVIRPAANPCDVLGTVSKDLVVTCNGETAGLLKVVVFGIKSLENSGVLLNLRFAAIGSAGSSSPLTFKGLMLNEGEPQARSTDGEITVSETPADSDSIGGRLITSTGEAVAKARVVLTAGSGETRFVYVDELGYFNFDRITPGETYVISVDSDSHKFTPQTVGAGQGMTQLTLIAEQ